VINVARGAHLVDDDLIALIDEGHLAGAALDVFRTEPLPPGPPVLAHPKITVTPHTSARTLRDESIAQIAGKIPHRAAGGRCLGRAPGADRQEHHLSPQVGRHRHPGGDFGRQAC
jgi:glyoxylate/hydroxypyruvate reductase A